ncbi:uncharacterized protein LOC120516762 isoform X2 [Polypterus senegalus]|uniref:uncharacterized protein LOC120516762 isoform X2 n=1 Tax=Polypterus senegalus TaxID=55291 RepID=UPI001962CD63|nr:uncharacterized protein LOC120516762 isoform X2 [Polypterus senegalus]
MEQDRNCTQLYAFIRSVFPNLNNEDLNVIVEKIQDLGVYHTEDVRYIKEEELLGVLKPVQARKLISSNLVTISDTCLASEVSVSALPASPCIIFCGDSLLTASCFMLSVDKNVVKENIPVFLEAFEMMFAAYYIFNIQYPSDVGSTLEFIQRCFANINPERGTKVHRSKSKKQYAVNPRVLTLISAIADFEWRQ